MTNNTYGTVAALQYDSRPEMDFADIVEEFDIAFQMIDTKKRSLTWDCEDIAIVDRDMIRVALGWLAPSTPDDPWHLIIAVGGNPDVKHNSPDPEYYGALADYIAERTNSYLPYDAVMLGEANRPISSKLIDVVAELLKLSAQATPDHVAPDMPGRPKAAGARRGTDEQSEDPAQPQKWTGPRSLIAQNEGSVPKRLTVYALSYTVMLQVPAIGAFMIVYALLRDTIVVA